MSTQKLSPEERATRAYEHLKAIDPEEVGSYAALLSNMRRGTATLSGAPWEDE